MTRRRPDQDPALPELSVREDVERELRAHIDMRTGELVEAGLEPEAARRRALREFGDYRKIARRCRDISSSPDRRRIRQMLDSLLQDLRFAVRTLAKSPGFVVVAVLTLALGIGANTAVFSVVNGVLLRPLPYPEPERLVAVWEADAEGRVNHVAAANARDWQAGTDSFTVMALHGTYDFSGPITVLANDRAARVYAAPVSRDFFSVMGVEPVLGRSFTAEEHAEGAPLTVVVSHAFWESVLGSQPGLDELTVSALGTSGRVVGVMPPGFHHPADTDIWFPAGLSGFATSRSAHNWALVGRLREGVTVEQARAELQGIHRAILQEDSSDADHSRVAVRPLAEDLYGSSRRPLMLLLGAAGLVLLVACTNLASAILARGARREREIAIRSSLGAHRLRIVRQLFTENLLLGFVGSLAGVVAGIVGVRGMIALAPASIPRAETIGLDLNVLLFTLGLALATTVAFGLWPSLRLVHGDVADGLRAGGRGADDGRGRTWSALIVAEVALALVLLIGCGLLVRSFRQVLAADLGFRTQGVLTVDISLPTATYPNNRDVADGLERILGELGTLPGVEAAGLISHLPLSGVRINGAFDIEGRDEEWAGYSDYRVVAAGYFEAMDVPVLRGRSFTGADGPGSPHVAVVNRTAAERYWPGEDPIGQRILKHANDAWIYPESPATVVGVVGDVRHRGATADPTPEVYFHYLQRPARARSAVITLRTGGEPERLVAGVRERIGGIDDRIPLTFAAMDAVEGDAVADRRFLMSVTGLFSVLALALAAVGIYGVVSYSTARRTREMGIRLALGAEPGDVRRMVVRGALAVVGVGAAVGTLAALVLTRTMESVLFGIDPADPITFATVLGLLLATAWVASVIPARRGARTDPMVTMRDE